MSDQYTKNSGETLPPLHTTEKKHYQDGRVKAPSPGFTQ
jgi:hypothetical protein